MINLWGPAKANPRRPPSPPDPLFIEEERNGTGVQKVGRSKWRAFRFLQVHFCDDILDQGEILNHGQLTVPHRVTARRPEVYQFGGHAGQSGIGVGGFHPDFAVEGKNRGDNETA